MSGLTSAAYFLISTLFSLVIFVLWLRLFIRYFVVNQFSSFTQGIYQLTDPLVSPIQTYITRTKGTKGPYDIPCFVMLIICLFLKFIVLSWLLLNSIPNLAYLFLYLIVDLIVEPCNILFYAIIIRVLISWINPSWQHPLANFFYGITEPILSFFRRYLPHTGTFDFSPLVAIIVLKIIELVLVGFLPFPMF